MILIYFLLILSITIFIHELGHFIFAKRANIYVHEFAIGMGPTVYSFRRKNDETKYAIRLIPLGGFVQMAGEEIMDDANIPDNRKLESKTWMQRFITIIAGALFNFLLAIMLLFFIAVVYGAPETKPILGEILEDFPTYEKGMRKGDLILSIDGKNMKTWDDVLMHIELVEKGSPLTFEIKKVNNDIETFVVEPILLEVDGESSYKYGLIMTENQNHGFFNSIKFAFVKFGTVVKSMFSVISNLIIGNLSVKNLAGPVGIYSIVGEEVSNGFMNTLFLIAFLSINVGFMNLLPFPAFDGGRVLFLIIEKIKGSRVDPRVENLIHGIGFALLILLMLIITIQDVKNLF